MNRKSSPFTGYSYVGILLVTSFFFPYAYAQSLQVISWNVESGDSETGVLADFIQEQQGIDLWGFVEVQNEDWATLFEEAAGVGEGADFASVLGTTGQEDRLLVVYNLDRLEVVNSFELQDINILGRVRAPLVVRFRVRESGQEFLFMVNHLYRSNAEARSRQAQMLNEWVQSQQLAVIAVGDYNFDWDVDHGEQNHDVGYDHLTQTMCWFGCGPSPSLQPIVEATTVSWILFFIMRPRAFGPSVPRYCSRTAIIAPITAKKVITGRYWRNFNWMAAAVRMAVIKLIYFGESMNTCCRLRRNWALFVTY
jgi:hypothetical protein